MAKQKPKSPIDIESAIASRIGRFPDLLSAATLAHSATGLQAVLTELDDLLRAACILERLVFTRNVMNSPAVPRALIDRLFVDNYLVAQLLTDAGYGIDEVRLLPLLVTRGEGFQLDIAMRDGLSESVTDFLIEIGGPEVAYQLARNKRARISKTSMATLVARAQRDRRLLQALSNRNELDGVRAEGARSGGLVTSTMRPDRRLARRSKVFSHR